MKKETKQKADSSDRLREIVETLTRAEKLQLVHGAYPDWDETIPGASGYLPPIDRLDIPPLRFENGPLGVQSAGGTAFPAPIALGASFNTDLAYTFGTAIGAEARAHGVDVLLAPGCNLITVPHCGRNFEYYGEDPVHSARLAAESITGIQSCGVVATPKHYVANNQEHDRVRMSVDVDERTIREFYLRAFEAAVTEGDAGAVMAAYNRINGTYAAEHEWLLTDILKDEFEFEGPVMSDWWAVQDGPAAAMAGLDLEMPGTGVLDQKAMSYPLLRYLRTIDDAWPARLPGPEAMAAWLLANSGGPGGMPRTQPSFARRLPVELDRGAFPEARLDDMVQRVLTLHQRVGALTGDRPTVTVDRPKHRAIAERIATSGAVLLKNEDDTLPLDPATTVAMIGPHIDEAKVGGGGSSALLTAPTTVSPVDGVRDRSTGRILTEHGHPPVEASLLSDFNPLSTLRSKADATADFDAARSVATDAAVAVLVVQDAATEGHDKDTLSLPGHQDALISTVAEHARRTVVVLQTAGPVEMPWLSAVDAVIEMWYPGQEAGTAIASLLYGAQDPGGRLPLTFAQAESDYPTSSATRYPGIEDGAGYPQATYAEGIFAGYRHFDDQNIDPLFPFGHGLSYTDFEYSAVETTVTETETVVSVTVTNTGDRHGTDVVQVYVQHSASRVPRPERELIGFETVALDAGETRVVQVPLDERTFAFYDERTGTWVTEPGTVTLAIGRSSRNIHATTTISIPE